MIGMYTERPDRNRLATKLLGQTPTTAVGIIFGETDGPTPVNLNTARPDRWDTALFTPESYQSLPNSGRQDVRAVVSSIRAQAVALFRCANQSEQR